ncbi:MAG: hypothetical protein Q8N88_00050 [Nanoarchaeota archaeon]|nr:hypothetical protein [Nanoarchaeota archaeon]
MANPLIPLNKPLLDLTSIITHPLVEEILLALMSLISIFLVLWFLSKLFNLKKQDPKTSFLIALISILISFIIRSISLIFSLTDVQKPIVNKTAMVIEIFLLFILIKKSYDLKWLKSSLVTIITYFGKFMIMGIITLIIILFFTTIPQDIERERLGDQIKIGSFETTKIDGHTFNFKSNISFVTRTENITITSLKCMIHRASLFPSIEDKVTEYKLESFDYLGLDLQVKGSAYFDCGSVCVNNKALINPGSVTVKEKGPFSLQLQCESLS